MPIFDEAAAVEAIPEKAVEVAWRVLFNGNAANIIQSSALVRKALAAAKPFLGGMQRLKDCEMSLAIFDAGRSSEYWERYASPDKGGE